MNHSVFADPHRIAKTFVACLIISLMILSPLAPLAQGAPKLSKRLGTASTLDPAPPFAPSITATKTDSFPDLDGDGKAAPGETITYDVNITNSGPDDATGVNFLDTIDANTTLVGGSLKVSPLAFPDVFVAATDTQLVVGAPGVLTNDTGLPAPSAVAIVGGATAQGGTVNLNTNGSFTYNPPAGFEGNDSFTYTATNGLTPNDTALVTINVDAPPSVVSTTPTNGATEQAQNTDITITFSEAVNVTGEWFQISCTESGVHAFADVDVSGGPTTFTLNPDNDFAATETCTVTVLAAQVTDQDVIDPPDQMAANFVFSFTTTELELAPTVSNTMPANGAVDQPTNTDITVTFSESVNVTGNWFTIACPTSGARNVADTVVTPASPATAFAINPNADFAPGETCTVTIVAAQVTDADSNDPPDNMAANFVFSFSMDAAPAVNATTPTNGATQVANNTNLSITFSEPVDVTGNWFQIVGASSGTRNVADTVVTGGPTTFNINPSDFTNGELVTVTVFAAQVTDQDTGDPPQNMAANFVFSFTIDQAPSVTATTPTNGATNQAANTDITITFSEPVNVTGNWFQIACATSGTRNVADTVVTGGPTTFTINPNTDFVSNETCTVTVFAAQVTDQDSGDPPDNMAANFIFSFTTTDAAPTVTTTTPANNATNQATNTDITVTFSESVNVTGNWFTIACPTSGARNVADTVVTPASPATAFTLNPNADFAPGETCTVTIVAAQVTDADSNDPPDQMAANFVFSFTMDAAPSVTATTPTNNANPVANNTNISITFSEPVDVTGNWFTIVGASSGTRNVADTVVTGGPTTFNIDPSDFTNGELVTVTVFAAQVADQDSADPPNNMAANFVFSFTIDQAPSVTATTPTNGAVNQVLNTNISITFSEPVNVTGNWFQIACATSGTRNVGDTVVTGGPTTFTINPNTDFAPNELCTVTVSASQVTDQDSVDPPDNMAANFVFSFTTLDLAPTVTATTPTNGAINQTTNTNLTVTFSESVNVTGNWFTIACPTSGARNVADTVVTPASPATTFTINPNADFAPGETCTVTIVATQVTDADTNDPPDQMAANFVFSFSMDAAPSVTATTPTNNATQVPNNTNISITFSEPVDVTGNWFQIVGASSGMRNVADTVVTGGPTTFNINPSDFTNGELVTVTVFAAQVADQDGNDPPQNMLANFVFSFTIDQAPSVTTTIPANNATNIAQNSTITINFSENVNVAAGGVTINCGSGLGFTPALPQNNITSIVLTPSAVLPAGSNCTVTLGSAQVTDTDTGDPPDNMVSDFIFTFKVKPDAVNDNVQTATGQTVIGNVSFNSAGIPYTVTSNDVSANPFTVTAFDATSANGGNVSVAANGQFTYNPPRGFEGNDTFNYTISRDDGGGFDSATVTINVAGMIWFIQNGAAACSPNCGRLSNPYPTLAAFITDNALAGGLNPDNNDNIFIFENAGSYSGALVLRTGQKLIGQDSSVSLTSITGLTPGTGSTALPLMNTGAPATTLTSTGVGVNLSSNNHIRGLTLSNTTGNAIDTAVNVGTFVLGDVIINNSASSGGGLFLDSGGTSVTTTGTNTINTRSGVGLNVTNTTIGATNMTFVSISVGNNDGNADPANGIVINNTGSGRLIVTGNGNTSVGGNSSGGTIQNVTGHAISLTNTQHPSFTNINIQSAGSSGVDGQQVTNFTLANSTINNVGTAAVGQHDESNISFNTNGAFNSTALSGTVSITQNTLTNARRHGIQIENGTGTISNLVITNNTLTSSTNAAVSLGSGILLLQQGNAANTSHLTTGNISGNTVTNFPSGEGIAILGGSGNVSNNTSATLGANGTPVTISNNTIRGQALAAQHMGSNAIRASMNSQVGVMNMNISCNGRTTAPCTATGPITNIQGQGISVFAGGTITGTTTIDNNVIVANQTLGAGTQGMALQVDDGPAGLLNSAANYNATITNNSVSNYEGNGIRVIARASLATLDVTINNNTVGIPSLGNRNAIRVDSGSAGSNTTLCMAMSGNTADGSGVNAGIGIRKEGTNATVNDFGIVGLAPSPTTAANAAAFVAAANPASVGGVDAISGDNYVSCAQTAMNSKEPVTNGVPAQYTAMRNDDSQPATKTVAKPQQSAEKRSEGASLVSLPKAKRDSGAAAASYSRSNSWVVSSSVNAMQDKTPRRGISVRPRVAPLAGETVSHSIGTLPAGKTVHIQFQVTVNTPYLGGETISNQGTVSGSNFTDVLTDDPAVGGANDPTTTPILQTPSVSVADAQANEPASGSVPMLFTISLSAPAPAGGASVQYETQDQAPALNHAVAGTDYTAVSPTTLNFAAGEQFKTVSVNILADPDLAEADETFLLILSNPTNAVIADGEATGTIKQGNAAGTFLISEIRTSGPGGAGDDFVEVYNNSDAPLTIAASDASAGYGLFKMGADCSATPVLIGTIPNGTVIPARGHYLFVGSAYSLGNYGGTEAAIGNLTLSEDLESDANVGIFNTSFVANLSSVTRLDAVGFGNNTGGNCDLLREGTTLAPLSGSTLEHSYVRDECGKKGNPAIFGPCPVGGLPKDTNVNGDDFVFVDTSAAVTVAGQRLGAPGPQNISSPIFRNPSFAALLLNSNFGGPAPPNRLRDLTPVTNGANGTLTVRRRFVNNTGAPVTRLRFRIVDISSISVPGGIADMRALTSTTVVVNGIADTATCAASGTPNTAPCSVTVFGTTLEQPPTQALGGAHNSSLSAGTITLVTPLQPGQSINLQFLLGVQQTGSFKFFFNIEALP